MSGAGAMHARGSHESIGRRRGRTAAAIAMLCAWATAIPARAFDLEDVAKRAEALARTDFVAPASDVPEWLRKISYDEWRKIRFHPEDSLWRDRGLSFEVQFFHPGLYFDRIVAIHEVDASGAHPITFSPNQFDYGNNEFATKVPQHLGYAGFRLHYPLKRKDYRDEVIVFLGASYFRAVGRDNGFGLSARGLAIDTALPSGEEFPFFREFWLVRPTRRAREIIIYALLDSPSLAGAYRFVIYPGEQTNVEVDARLFRRRAAVQQLGIAPLTSMFFHGENTGRWFDDFRPEVHDSDGLLIEVADERWIWRPLDNPERLTVNAFAANNPRGFGLVQRDRNFDHYQDLETKAEQRPSVWVHPSGDWGGGRVVLVQIPTESDINDNIVAFWAPYELPALPQPLKFSYRMAWYADDPGRSPIGRVVATRRDTRADGKGYRFVIDFAGKGLADLPDETILRAHVSVTANGDPAGEIVDQYVVRNQFAGGWRLSFLVRPDRNDPVELRAFLDRDDKVITENWTYTLQP